MKRVTLPLSSSFRFAILITTLILVLARPSRTPVVRQPDTLPIAQEPYPGVSPNLSQVLQEAPFAQSEAGAVKANVALSGVLANAAPAGASPSTSSTGLSSLPRDAQGPISAALGKGNSLYWAHADGSGFRTESPQQHGLVVNFTKQGAQVRSQTICWGLETRGYGYGDALRPLSAVVPNATANRVEYRRGSVTEWYLNGPMGLEQGFTLAEPPGKARKGRNQPLTLALAISGDLVAVLEPAGPDKKSTALTLAQKDGQPAFRYTGLNVRDAVGRELRSWLELRGERLMLRVEDGGARYPVVVDPWILQAELIASDGAASDNFGWSVAVSGSTAVVGAIEQLVGSNPSQGKAYVFVQSGATWSQQAELTASDGAAGDLFGVSVAVDGGTIVVGAKDHMVGSNVSRGAAYVFVQSGTTWSQQAELTASDGAVNDRFGWSVAVSGSTVVVGAVDHRVGSNANQGSAYVFVQSGTTWSQQAELTASDGAANDKFGWSVAVSGSTAVVGAIDPTVGSNASQGAAYVFVQSGATWSEQEKLTASDGAANDYFGSSVAVSGVTAVVGSPGKDYFDDPGAGFTHSSTYVGAAYVFVQSGATWSQQAELTPSDGVAGDMFGVSVAVDGDTAVVGALNHAVGAGTAYVFVQNGTTWSQQEELTASDGKADDNLGQSVAVSGGTAVVGSPWRKIGSNSYQGATYVFGPGEITVTPSPTSLNFSNEALDNTSGAKTVTLANTSTGTLNVASITTNGDFAISSTTCGAVLTAGKTCKVNVTFTPTELGALAGTLTLIDNASNSPQTVELSGTGIVEATLIPASKSYGKATVGTTTNPIAFTLANERNVPLTGISISTTGDFAVSATTCTTSLGAKGKCTIDVTFTPTQTGALTGQLSVTDNASNSPQTSNLTGTGK